MAMIKRVALGGLLGSMLVLCACEANNMTTAGADAGGGSDGGGGDGSGGGSGTGGNGSGGGSGSGGGGTISGNWTALALRDDAANRVIHAGEDRVTGIYFASLDRGWIVTQGANQSSGRGGAVFTATRHMVTGIAFAAPEGGPRQQGAIDFHGLEATPTGHIAFAYAGDVVQSVDAGATFQITENGNSRLGGAEVLAYRVTSRGTTLVADTGVVATSPAAPGPAAAYTDVWAPNGIPPTPDPVPRDECQGGPIGSGLPVTRDSVYISPDAQFIAYTSNPDHDPQICISRDGGRHFKPSHLTVPPEDDDVPATGVLFLSASVGITWLGGADVNGIPFIQRTTDGGATWTNVALPPSLVPLRIELHGAFFAPDRAHGWITGYDREARTPLLLATSDGGVSWSTVASGLAEAVRRAGGDKLICGFALDAEHFWVGGERGLVLAHE